MMKTIILPVSMLSALALTACIPLDSDKVGVEFDFAKEASAALSSGNFDPTQSKFSASKSTTAGFTDVTIATSVSAVANGTSRIKNGAVWDRVQNHPITIGLDVNVSASTSDAASGNTDSATINKANFAIKGNLGSASATEFLAYESDKDGKLSGKKISDLSASDFIPTGGTIRAIISDGTLEDYASNLLIPFEEIAEEEMYGVYRNGDQYTAFFAAGTASTVASTVKDKDTASKYAVTFRGIADWGDKDYNGLKGTGDLNVNFKAGTYKGDITVKDGSNTLGEIAFAGSSINTITFNDNAATYTPTGKSAVTGNVEGSAYGSDAATFMGTADFVDGSDMLIGAFNAKSK